MDLKLMMVEWRFDENLSIGTSYVGRKTRTRSLCKSLFVKIRKSDKIATAGTDAMQLACNHEFCVL